MCPTYMVTGIQSTVACMQAPSLLWVCRQRSKPLKPGTRANLGVPSPVHAPDAPRRPRALDGRARSRAVRRRRARARSRRGHSARAGHAGGGADRLALPGRAARGRAPRPTPLDAPPVQRSPVAQRMTSGVTPGPTLCRMSSSLEYLHRQLMATYALLPILPIWA